MSGERQPFHGFRSYAAIKRLREGRTIYEVMEWQGGQRRPDAALNLDISCEVL